MSFTETIAAGRAFAGGGEPTPQPNRELLATGFANAGGALLASMPAGGGTTQTAVNRLAGARTQLAGLVTAAGHARDDAAAGSLHRADAGGYARSRRHRVFDRPDPAGGVSLDPRRAVDGVRLGPGRAGWRSAARNPAGDPRRHHRLARSLSPTRSPIRRSMCSGASRAPTYSDRVPRSIPRTRPSPGC